MQFDPIDILNILNKYFVIDAIWIAFSAIPAWAVYYYSKDKMSKRRLYYGTLFVFYTFLVFCYTVLSRGYSGTIKCQLEFLWSYRAARFNKDLLIEIILNYILFIPFGLFYVGAHKRSRKYVRAVILGFSFSSLIEILQLVTYRGLFEFDDILGNTIGALIGSVIYYLHRKYRIASRSHRHKHKHHHRHHRHLEFY